MFKIVHLNYFEIVFHIYFFSLWHHSFNSTYSTGIYGYSDDLRTWPLADISGYFVIGFDITNIAKICKYTFSTSSAQCQTISNIVTGYGQLMITSSQFFVVGVTPASPYNLLMYKFTFSLTSVNWANRILCASGTWTASYSESMLSSDGSTIYLLFTFGATRYFYFAGMSLSSGSVTTTRYKSSVSVNYIWRSALSGDYIVAATFSPIALILYSISSSTFTTKSFSGNNLNGVGVDPSNGR